MTQSINNTKRLAECQNYSNLFEFNTQNEFAEKFASITATKRLAGCLNYSPYFEFKPQFVEFAGNNHYFSCTNSPYKGYIKLLTLYIPHTHTHTHTHTHVRARAHARTAGDKIRNIDIHMRYKYLGRAGN